MYASHSGNSAERIALNQSGHDRPAFIGAQFVHAFNMLERSSIVNDKFDLFMRHGWRHHI
jgi:hypothetical protein